MVSKTYEITKLIDALENKKFQWRTMGGLKQDTKFSEKRINRLFSKIVDSLLQSTSKDGEPIYTTRDHWTDKASFIDNIKASFSSTSL